MDNAHIYELLQPFLQNGSSTDRLSETQLGYISTYIDILMKWNARINLTAIREPEEIVTRHFGESLFAARQLFHAPGEQSVTESHLLDIGSGPGFPGLPIKIWAPRVSVTLVESNHKKVAFLREVCRTVTLTNVDVCSSRAEELPPGKANVVTLRAVERFETILPNAIRLLKPHGRIALLIGGAQISLTEQFSSQIQWHPPIPIPLSANRVLLVGTAE